MNDTPSLKPHTEFILGAGYNPAFTLAGDTRLAPLELPESISYLELGLAELEKWLNHPGVRERHCDLSLHLARTPVSEDAQTQENFIDYIAQGIEKAQQQGAAFVSIGIHLTGPRHEGIGRLGFSSHYYPDETVEARAIAFIEALSQRTHLPVWLENANFYSPGMASVFASWRSVNTIAHNTGAGLIVDLSHMLIDARNNGADPRVIIGLIPWRAVREIHLSGIIEAADGSLHDGHSAPVHEEVWCLLETCLAGVLDAHPLPDAAPRIVTVEHTDPLWIRQPETFHDDFSRLHALLAKERAHPDRAERAGGYAKGYLKKLLNQWLPNVKPLCQAQQLDYNQVVEDWIDQVTRKNRRRIVLTRAEIPDIEYAQVEVAAPSFLDYAKRRLGQ